MTTKGKAVFLTYSLTGNTRFVAEQIGKGLVDDCDFDVVYIDAIQVCKTLNLGEIHSTEKFVERSVEISNSVLEKPKALDDLERSVESADFFGIGAFAWHSNPAPGFVSLLEDFLPSSLFDKIKYYCVYSSYGGMAPQIPGVFANILKKKAQNAKFLGSIDILCPENGVSFLPFKPEYDGMSFKELKKLQLFVKKVTTLVSSASNGEKGVFPPIPSPPFISMAPMQNSFRSAGRHPLLNKQKCVKCGLCVRLCPFNVIVMKGKTKKRERENGGGEVEGKNQCVPRTAETEGEKIKKKTCNDIGDIEEGFPVWMDAYEKDWGSGEEGVGGKGEGKEKGKGKDCSSQCWACGRCFNMCPQEAIEMTTPDTTCPLRTRYRGPVFPPSSSSSSISSSSSTDASSLETTETELGVKTPIDAIVHPLPHFVFIFPRAYGWGYKKTQRVYRWVGIIVLLVFLVLLFLLLK